MTLLELFKKNPGRFKLDEPIKILHPEDGEQLVWPQDLQWMVLKKPQDWQVVE